MVRRQQNKGFERVVVFWQHYTYARFLKLEKHFLLALDELCWSKKQIWFWMVFCVKTTWFYAQNKSKNVRKNTIYRMGMTLLYPSLKLSILYKANFAVD